MSKMALDYDAINISQGYPDFDSDPELIALVHEAMKDGHNQYAPMPGQTGLRHRISERILRDHQHQYHPDTEITVTAGATQAIFSAIAATIHTGDEVILFAPAYDCYEPAVRLFGGMPVVIQMNPPEFKPDWDLVKDSITSKTRMIIINSPHNPSGSLMTEGDMNILEELVETHQLYVISDEVYEHLIYDGHTHYSAARFPALVNRSFITASFGKTFHNTGWKIGYCVAPAALTKEFRKVHQYVVFSVNHPIQRALATYMEDTGRLDKLGPFYQKKRDLFAKAMEGSKFKLLPSSGSYFQLMDYSNVSDAKDVDFATYLTMEEKVATIPTSVFNASGKDFRLLRVCFAKKDETLAEAANRLSRL